MVVLTHEQARVVWAALDKHLPRITGRVRRLAASIEGEGFDPTPTNIKRALDFEDMLHQAAADEARKFDA